MRAPAARRAPSATVKRLGRKSQLNREENMGVHMVTPRGLPRLYNTAMSATRRTALGVTLALCALAQGPISQRPVPEHPGPNPEVQTRPNLRVDTQLVLVPV